MKKLRLYEYARCSTCQKARRFLDARGIAYEAKPIVDQPPTRSELRRMLAHYDGKLGKLFNSSGEVYRELGLAQKLKSMNEDEALALLEKHGKLVKRPFLLGDGVGLVGFKEDEWKKLPGAC